MLGFTAILIAMLWILQTIYLDKFYKYIKMKELNNAVAQVEKNIGQEQVISNLNSIAKTYDVCILIADSQGKTIYSAESNINCTIHFMSPMQIVRYYEIVQKNGGEMKIDSYKITTFDLNKNQNKEDQNNENQNKEDVPGRIKFDNFQGMPRRNMSLDGVVAMKIITTSDENNCIMMVNSIITPVDATVYTIRIQLIYISIILIILALLMASFVSMRISKSIAKVNKGAKELAKRNYNVTFEGKDYKEIAELSDTLNYAAKELGKAENLQKDLIANVSHDLRTPLTMITAYSEVMRDIPGENTPENVQVIIDEAKRLTMLVNDLLDISKLQAGAEVLDIKEYDLTEAIKGVIDRYSKLVEQDGYKIEFRYYSNVMVKADEFKIYQVVYNLVNNAINYTGEDKTVIVNQIVNGNVVRIEVCDTGVGIPKEEQENVWERYYKIDKTHKRAVMGTGLGLSIVNSILNKHNSRHGVESETGKGSIFWFELETVSK